MLPMTINSPYRLRQPTTAQHLDRKVYNRNAYDCGSYSVTVTIMKQLLERFRGQWQMNK